MAKKISEIKDEQAEMTPAQKAAATRKANAAKKAAARKAARKAKEAQDAPSGTQSVADAIQRHEAGSGAVTVSSQALAGIEATQRGLAADTTASVPDVEPYAPTDFSRVSSTLEPMSELDSNREVETIKDQGYRLDVVLANVDLALKTEQGKEKLAKLLQAKAKTQTAVEGITTELSAHQMQQEKTATKQAELANAILEREGVEGLAGFIRQKREARYAKELATVRRMEASAAKTMAAVDVEHVELPGGDD
jgi:hypothetical protein